MIFTPYRLYHKPRLRGKGVLGCCFAPRSKVSSCRTRGIRRREVKEEDGVPSRPQQMVVKVGSGSSGYTFKLKGAEWADVKAGSHDAAVPASVPNMPSLQLERPPSLAPDFELSDGAGS